MFQVQLWLGNCNTNTASYYWASQLVVLNEWCMGDRTTQLTRLNTGLYRKYKSQTYMEIVYQSLPYPPKCFLEWSDTQSSGVGQIYHPGNHLWNGIWLRQVTELQGFKRSDSIGISKLGDLMKGTTLKSSTEGKYTTQSPIRSLPKNQTCPTTPTSQA